MDGTNLVTAGSFVASVLEHAGYMKQAEFLVEFKEFFRDAGGLVYLIAAIGAVFSVAIYGSFRAARYLLIGPALFWFLVGPTTESEGVLWKIGGGEYRGQADKTGQGEAESFRDQVLRELDSKGGGVSKNIKVASGFWLFAYPINEFINEFVDVILKDEDGSDKLAFSKTRGLEILFQQLPKTEYLVDLIEGSFLGGCGRMFFEAQAASELYLREKMQNSAGGGTGISPQQQELREFYMERVRELGKIERVVTGNTSLWEYIDAYGKGSAPNNAVMGTFNLDGVAGLARSDARRMSRAVTSNTVAKSLLDNNEPVVSVSCEDVWKVVAENVWYYAKAEMGKLLDAAAADDMNQRGAACLKLEEKLFGNNSTAAANNGNAAQNGDCETSITVGIAIAMLANSWNRTDTYSRLMRRHWNERDLINPTKSTITTGIKSPDDDYELFRDENNEPEFHRGVNNKGDSFLEVRYVKKNNNGEVIDNMWAPMTTISAIHGMSHAMWVATARFETVNLRQQIFSYALQLPYYQGVLLYMLAVAYPFLAIVVLLPGRAHNMLNLPLAWLWVKSWDIGFAVVMILDKIMYNMLPSVDYPEELKNGPWLDIDLLPLVMSEAAKVNPMRSLHMFYALIAMVMLGIPALTGAATLKARKAVLSSWTDAATAQARDAGRRGAGAFSIAAGNVRAQMMRQIQGFARRASTMGSGGVASGIRGSSSELFASMAGLGHMAKGGLGSVNPQRTAEAFAEYHEKKATWLGKETKMEGEMLAMHDPMLGRWGTLQMMNDMYAAAMDGGGGFEMNDPKGNAINSVTGLMTDKLMAGLDFTGNLAEGAIKSTSGTDIKNGDVPAFGALFAAGLMMLYKGKTDDEDLAEGMEGLKDWSGAQSYSMEEFFGRVFHMDASTMSRFGLDSRFASANPDKPSFLQRMFGVLNPSMVPGGVSWRNDVYGGGTSSMDVFLRTAGGYRTPETENTPGWKRWGIQGGAGLIGAGMGKLGSMWTEQDLEEERKRQRAEDIQFNNLYRKENPEEYNKMVSGLTGHILQQSGSVFSSTSTMSNFQQAGDGFTASSAMVGELAAAALQHQEQLRQQNPDLGVRSMPGAMPQYGELPSDIQSLAKTNPLLAAQLIDEWNEKRLRNAAGARREERMKDILVSSPGDLLFGK